MFDEHNNTLKELLHIIQSLITTPISNIDDTLYDMLSNQTSGSTLRCIFTNETTRRALNMAIDNEDFDMIRLLVNKCGIDINVRDNNGQTAIFRAVNPFWINDELIDNPKATRVLLELGAGANVRDKDGKTPLHYAVRTVGKIDSTRLLLEHGANINVKDNKGQTPLHYAVTYGSCIQEKTTKLLLDRGANVNIKDNLGRTPLHYASGNGNVCGVGLLLNHGADPNIRDNDGQKALHKLNHN